MAKIILQISGGLGNQLFQFAFGRNLAMINNTDLLLDTLTYYNYKDKFNKINFLLKYFKINARIITQDELNWANNVRIWQRIGIAPKWIYIGEKTFDKFDEDVLRKYNKNLLIYGCWQNENYFKSISSQLKKEFTVKEKYNDIYNNIIVNSNSVAIHLRRCDYIETTEFSSRYYDLFSSGYYKKAIEYLKSKLSDPVFFIFSDDIVWCKKNLPLLFDVRFNFIENTDDPVHDFYLMTLCKHQVIANSTFSWWAAWLNNYEKKIVICPHKWFLNDWEDNHFALSGWIKI